MVILSVQEAAKFLGKTPAALRNGYKRWGVPHFRLGGQIKFTQEALQEWVEKGMTVETDTTASAKNGRRARRAAVETKPTSHSGSHIA
ncbi:MAG: helix-turn-helix domain-containing protein [Calditrichaeota bacterium]|nr:helix-turn-helix domain-containing protein [Calditrichota bacterium]MCB9391759.1 helix-turn-helix domain-containing protein [Calditrichota bacterium]